MVTGEQHPVRSPDLVTERARREHLDQASVDPLPLPIRHADPLDGSAVTTLRR
jgi:hypothetical protein